MHAAQHLYNNNKNISIDVISVISFILLINFNFDKYTKIKECALDRLLRPFRLLCLIQKNNYSLIKLNSSKKKSGFGTLICSDLIFPFSFMSNHNFPSGKEDKLVSNLKVNIS